MSAYTEEGIQIKEEPSKKEIKEEELKEGKKQNAKKTMKEKDYYTYKLVGVVVHNGNAEAGHYYSYINIQRSDWENSDAYLKTDQDRWVEFNDSIIREFNFQKLESECFGGSQEDVGMSEMEDIGEYSKLISGRSKSAYLLIYERKRKFPIPVKIDKSHILENDIIVNTLECESTAISRADKENMRLIYKDEKDNTYVLHKYHHLPFAVPKAIETVNI